GGRLGFLPARADPEPARVAVDPVYSSQRPRVAGEFWQQIGERRREKSLAAGAELRRFLHVPHRRQTWRLLGHDDLVVNVNERRLWQRRLLGARRFRSDGPGGPTLLWRLIELNVDALADLEPAHRAGADL